MNRETMRTTALAAAAALAVTACSEEPEVPPQPIPSATAPPAPSTAAPVPPPPPVPAAQTGPCDANTQLALQTAIEARAKKEVQGAKPVGTTINCEFLAEGGTLTVPVQLQSGKCYTVLAHSMGNVTDIDMFLKLNVGPNPPPALAALSPVLGQDAENGPTASIGAGGSCYKQAIPLIPIAAQVEATAKVGAGPIAVRIYEK